MQNGTPEYNEIVDRYRGAIGQFHRANQQQVAINGQEQRAVSKRVDGAHLRYQNNQGQETITVVIDPVEGHGQEHPVHETPWEFALIDFVFPGMDTQSDVFMGAFMTKPLTPEQKAMTGDTRMPVQGISAIDWNQHAKPLVEIGDWTVTDAPVILETSGETDMVRSLRVDLRPFPFQTIEVDIYGYAYGGFSVTGGDGVDADGNQGQLLSSTRYGSLTLDYRAYASSAWDPSVLATVPKVFFWENGAESPAALDQLIETFPELTITPKVDLSGLVTSPGDGDWTISVLFKTGVFSGPWSPNDITTNWNDAFFNKPSSVSPTNDPNQWWWLPQVTPSPGWVWDDLTDKEEWSPGTGIWKRKTINCSIMDYNPDNTGDTYVTSVPLTAAAASSAQVSNNYQIQYFVPTWFFVPAVHFTVRAVCARNGNPWKAISHRANVSGDSEKDTYQFEVPSTFPNRPPMKDVGAGKFIASTSSGGVDGHDWDRPSKFFGGNKVGVLKIDTRHGSVKFEAA